MSGERLVKARVAGEEGVARALLGLRNAGVPRRSIEVLSDIPLPPGLLGGHMRATRLPWYTALGLLGGLFLGLLLAVGTVFLYPLLVGGQSVISPPVFVITYELTMLGIVVLTVGGLIFETRLMRDSVRASGIQTLPGETLVVVKVPPDITLKRVHGALEREGAQDIEVREVAA
jgi:hypothetical protein